MEWVKVVEVAGAVLAGIGGALLALSIFNGGSAPLGIAAVACAVIGWSGRLWARSKEDRDARRRLR